MTIQPNTHFGGEPSAPLTYQTFAAGRINETLRALVFERWLGLSDEDKEQRTSIAFELLCGDEFLPGVGAPDAAIAGLVDPDLWWADTVLGRRAVAALAELEVAFSVARCERNIELAWYVLDAASGMFGVTVWLHRQEPFHHEPQLEWLDALIERCGYDPEELVTSFAFEADAATLEWCVQAASNKAWELDRDDGSAMSLLLYIRGVTIPDTSVVLMASSELTALVDRRLTDALDGGDRQEAAKLIVIGAGALELACRVGLGYGLADGQSDDELF